MAMREEAILYLDSNEEERLAHFGVLGMKWGVTRRRELHANRMKDLDKVGTYKNDTGDKRSILGKTPERKKQEMASVVSDVKKFREARDTNSNAARGQRQILKDQLKQRTTYHPEYRKAFDKELAKQDAALKAKNPDYSSSMRQRDRLRFTGGGIERINTNMNKGMTYQEASKKELARKKLQARVTTGAVVAATILQAMGPVVMSEVSRKAATNRDRRAQAYEDFIRNGPQKPSTKIAKQRRGVYNVTTL